MLNRIKQKKWVFILAFLLASGGFIIPFWPLEVLGILAAAFGGLGVVAIGLGLLLDLAYGMPTGFLHYLFFPFTLLAILALAGRYFGLRVLFERAGHDTL